MSKIHSELAKHYIKKNYQSIYLTEEIARGINCNYHTLREQFVRETGMTLGKYLNLIRCENAKNCLNLNNWKLFKIARNVGFNDDKYFIKVFEKYFGIPPHTYRKQLKTHKKVL